MNADTHDNNLNPTTPQQREISAAADGLLTTTAMIQRLLEQSIDNNTKPDMAVLSGLTAAAQVCAAALIRSTGCLDGGRS